MPLPLRIHAAPMTACGRGRRSRDRVGSASRRRGFTDLGAVLSHLVEDERHVRCNASLLLHPLARRGRTGDCQASRSPQGVGGTM
jgi:hypothetical protein